MIKATMRSGDGKDIVILGLSGENMTRLMSDEPILVDLADLGLDANIKVALIGGRTEADIAQQMKDAGMVTDEMIRRGTQA